MTACSRRQTVLRAAMMSLTPLLFTASSIGGAVAEDKSIASIAKGELYAGFIAEAAQRFELPAAWIRAVIRAESGGDPRAISPKGAIGLMQIMPDTWAEIRIRHRLDNDPYDPHDNIIAGTAYIRQLYDRFGSPGWIAAYNAGPSRYEASLKGHPLPAETRAYVAAVAQNLDGKPDADNTVAVLSDAPVWSRAPLFIAQSDRTQDADPASISRRPNDTTADMQPTANVRDVSAIVPQSAGLFIARVDEGTAR